MARETKGDGSTARDLARLRSLRRRTGDEVVIHGDENLQGGLCRSSGDEEVRSQAGGMVGLLR